MENMIEIIRENPVDNIPYCGNCGSPDVYADDVEIIVCGACGHKDAEPVYGDLARGDVLRRTRDYSDLPSDYEPCSVCGYDHEYEPGEAQEAHRMLMSGRITSE